jgi:hypothetical protein
MNYKSTVCRQKTGPPLGCIALYAPAWETAAAALLCSRVHTDFFAQQFPSRLGYGVISRRMLKIVLPSINRQWRISCCSFEDSWDFLMTG